MSTFIQQLLPSNVYQNDAEQSDMQIQRDFKLERKLHKWRFGTWLKHTWKTYKRPPPSKQKDTLQIRKLN